MRSFPATFTAELNRPGCLPYWLLVIVANGVTYYLSDNDRTITALGATAYGVIKSWGVMAEGSGNGTLAGYNVSEYTVQVLTQLPISAGGMTIDTLASAGYLDDAQADMYLGLAGISDPPQLINPGYIRDFGQQTDTTLPLMIQDKTILLERSYVGRKVTNSAYPQAASADIGKVIPIPFGVVKKIPALALAGCIQTVLTVACTAADTTLYVTSTANIAAGMSFLVEAELVYISSVGSYTVTVTRGYSGTTAAAHTKGASVVQYTTQVYAAADRAVTSIDRVWLRLSDDLDLDITAYCTRYNGQAWDYLAGYSGMAVASITPAGMASILDIIQLRQQDTIGVATGNHDHAVQLSRLQVASNAGVQYGGSTSTSVTVTPTYPALSGTLSGIVEQTNTYRFAYGGNTSAKNVYVNGNLVQSGFSSSSGFDWSGTTVGLPDIVVTSGSTNVTVTILSAQRSVVYDSTTTSEPADGVAKTGSAQMTGSAMTSYFGSGKILVDVTADNGTPQGMANWLLSQRGLPAVQTVGTLTAAAFNGLINDYQTCLYWLNKIAFECGAWFMMPTSVPKLISRQPSHPVAAIAACISDENGTRSLTRTRTALADVIDLITVLYNRDWSQSKSDTAYNGATPQAGTGTRERPDLFQLDFITDTATALALRDLYLSLQQDRHIAAAFDVWVDLAALESGDTVTLSFLGDATGTILPAEQAPGNFDRADTVKLTVLI